MDDDVGSQRDDSGDVTTKLSRDMGLFDITFIGVGAMIGAGVFALTGFAAGLAGPALLISFVLNGCVAAFTAASYAELGAAFPEAGGGYLWVNESLVEPNGFYAGWMSWFAHAVACSLYAVTFGVFLTEFVAQTFDLATSFVLFGVLSRAMAEKLLAVVMIALFAYINYGGAKHTGRAGVIVTSMKLLILGVFVCFGIAATIATPDWPAKFLAHPRFAPNGVVGIIGAMGFTYIAFEGYEIIVQSGEEVVDPGTNVPKAIFYSLVLVVPIYVLVAFVSIGGITVTPEVIAGVEGASLTTPTWNVLGQLGELGIIEAAGQFMPYGGPLLLIAGLAATVSALNATIYSSSRVSFAMGRDGTLPSVLQTVHEERRTPSVAIGLSALLIVVMAIVLPIEAVAAAADLMFILLFIQVNWTVVKMRRTHPDLPRTYTIPYMPWPPLIGIVLQFLLAPFMLSALGLEVGVGPNSHGFIAIVTTAIWMILGAGVYLGYSTEQIEKQREAETPTVATETIPGAGRDRRILVPVADPTSVEPMLSIALDLARDQNAEIEVLSVVTVPQQTPLEHGQEFVDAHRAVIDAAFDVAADRAPSIPICGTIRIGHGAGKAILNTIEQHDVDCTVLGWRGSTRRREFIFGSTVDPVVRKANSDVLVKRIGHEMPIDSLLLPTAGGAHGRLAADIAGSIARANDASVDILHVTGDEGHDTATIEAWFDDAEQRLDGVPTQTILSESKVVTDEIVERSDAYDITVIGAARGGFLRRLLFGDVPEAVGKRAKHSVILVKKHDPLVSRLNHWLLGHE
ncbi:amino acid permease [Halocatena halophila]|uniref:amino acid permease n=1 Tax=Halocatena halophila TaxID=2814576 RepID=UPI002ED4E0CD